MMKKPDFLHNDTDSWKIEILEKYCGGHGQKIGVATLFSGL